LGIKEAFTKKKEQSKVAEVDADVIETNTNLGQPTSTDKVTLELTVDELLVIGKVLEQSESTQLALRVQEGSDNINILDKIVKKLPKK
jgi:hypothetical protein